MDMCPLDELYLQQDHDLAPDAYDFAKHATHKALSFVRALTPALSYLPLVALLLSTKVSFWISLSGLRRLQLMYVDSLECNTSKGLSA